MLIKSIIMATTILIFLTGSSLGQQSANGVPLLELSNEMTISRLQENFNTIVFGAVAYAKIKGEKAEDIGAFIGRLAAGSWSKGVTPSQFAAKMNKNWQSLGIKTRVLSISENAVSGVRTHPYEKSQLKQDFRYIDGNLEDYQKFFYAAIKEIAKYHGLEYSERETGEGAQFTIVRRGKTD